MCRVRRLLVSSSDVARSRPKRARSVYASKASEQNWRESLDHRTASVERTPLLVESKPPPLAAMGQPFTIENMLDT